MNSHIIFNYKKTSFLYLIIGVVALCFSQSLKAVNDYSLVSIGYPQGLSNSAVLSLYQDDEGFMWFGTYDGLNNYDGKSMHVYRADNAHGESLLNNVIYEVNGAPKGCLWISTNTGINLFSIQKRSVIGTYEKFKDGFKLFSNRQGDTWVLDQDSIFWFNALNNSFVGVMQNKHNYKIELSFVDDKGFLWLFSEHENHVYKGIIENNGSNYSSLKKIRANIHQKKIVYTFHQNGMLSFIDQDFDLFLFDLSRNTKVYIRNVKELIDKYGTIQGIISFYDDIILAFIQNGLVKLEAASRYAERVIDHKIRIFSIYKDPVQDIVWIGTDGQGAMLYTKKHAIAEHLMFSDMRHHLIRQVRSVYTDPKGNLWFGTKGDGLVKVRDYTRNIGQPDVMDASTVYFPTIKKPLVHYHRKLNEFQVFCIVPSRYFEGFWIGSAGNAGLLRYEYQNDMVIPIEGNVKSLQKVHTIFEENDSILWMTTSGNGLCKVHLKNVNKGLVVDSVRQIVFYRDKKEVNDFFPMCVQNDSIMWLGSRGMGLVRYNYKEDTYQVLSLGDKEHHSHNDILAIYMKEDLLYLGTVSGLVCFKYRDGKQINITCMGREQGFLNDMIHGILEDENGFLWLSTNKGLIKYNPKNSSFHTYYYSNGLQIGEFSDDAFYKCPITGNLFFGGIDGLLYLNKDVMNEVEYSPAVHFRDLTIGVENVHLHHYYNEEKNLLTLKGLSLAFSISFAVPDFVAGDNLEFSYKLEGSKDADWTLFSANNVASFKSLPYGDYVLKVRYKKDVFDTEYSEYSLNISILPPWYYSFWAYVSYVVVLLLLILYGFRLAKRHYRREKLIKKLIHYERRNAVWNSADGQFHRNMGTVASIFQQCEALRSFEHMPSDYYALIDGIYDTALSFSYQAENLCDEQFNLSQYIPNPIVKSVPVSLKEISDEVCQTLLERGHSNLSTLEFDIDDSDVCNLPVNAYRYFLYYLYLRASLDNRNVRIKVRVEDATLKITANLPLDISKDLIHAESDNEKTWSNEIDFSSCLYRWLYRYGLHVMEGHINMQGVETIFTLSLKSKSEIKDSTEKNYKTILLLEDKKEWGWLINDLLHEDYHVQQVATAKDAFRYLKNHQVDVFLADTMIYLQDERQFLEYVKTNKGLLMNTVFIPLMTWKAAFRLHQEFKELVNGVVVMPYNVLFLKANIDMALLRFEARSTVSTSLNFEEESSSPIQCNTPEQSLFVQQFLEVLNNHLDCEDLNTAFIAEKLNISPRQYYRKFKEVSSLSPTDYVKNYRIEKAASLLADTDWPISRVISEVGIQSRSYFYKEFDSRYGLTPKEYRNKCRKREVQD